MGRLGRALGLRPTDEPRRYAVGARNRTVLRDVAGTPGAKVRIGRGGTAEEQLALLWCARRGIAFERVAATGVWGLEADASARLGGD
jgi:hypothetical protein